MTHTTAMTDSQDAPFYGFKSHDLAKKRIELSIAAEIDRYVKEFLSVGTNAIFTGLFEEHGAIEMLCFVKDFHINPAKFIGSSAASAQSVVDVIRRFSGHGNELDALLEFFERKRVQVTELEILTVLSGTPYPNQAHIELCVCLLGFVREKLASALNDFNRSAGDTDTIALSLMQENSSGLDHTQPQQLRGFVAMFIENVAHFVSGSKADFNKPDYSKKYLDTNNPVIQVAGLIGINNFMRVVASPLSEQGLPPVWLLKEVVANSDSQDALACIAANMYLQSEDLLLEIWQDVLVSTIQKLQPRLPLIQIAKSLERGQRREVANQDNSKRLFGALGILLVGAAAMSLKEPYEQAFAPL